jgi:hypothetical protein
MVRCMHRRAVMFRSTLPHVRHIQSASFSQRCSHTVRSHRPLFKWLNGISFAISGGGFIHVRSVDLLCNDATHVQSPCCCCHRPRQVSALLVWPCPCTSAQVGDTFSAQKHCRICFGVHVHNGKATHNIDIALRCQHTRHSLTHNASMLACRSCHGNCVNASCTAAGCPITTRTYSHTCSARVPMSQNHHTHTT